LLKTESCLTRWQRRKVTVFERDRRQDRDRRADPMRNSNSFATLPGQPGGGCQKPDECLRLPDPFWKDQIQSASDQRDLVLHSGPAMRRGLRSPATAVSLSLKQ
jgi:hypothetical protein